MKYYIITDCHFGYDKDPIEFGRFNGYENKILKSISNSVKEDDILINLGDLAYKDDKKWIDLYMQSTKAKKWLVLGNHDKHSMSFYLNHGFDFVGDRFSLDVFGKKILFSHVPMINNEYDFNIHGHFHTFETHKYEAEFVAILNDKHILIAMEKTNYQPVSLEALLKKIKKN